MGRAARGAAGAGRIAGLDGETPLWRQIGGWAPASLPRIDGIRLGAAYRAALEAIPVGGDFYELRPEDGGWSFTLGDACGKGVEAAVLTGQVCRSLRSAALVDPDPVRRLELLNSALLAAGGTSFVTLVHGVMRRSGRGVAVELAAGGHPAPLLLRDEGRVDEVRAPGPIVGMLPDVEFEPARLLLGSGETLVCFTDGLPDARGPSGFLGVERLGGVLQGCDGMTAQAIADRLMDVALDHLGGRPHDDMAILAVQVDPDR